MAAASIQRTLAALAVAVCLFGPTSIATAENLFKIPGTDYYISLDAAQPLNTADSQPLLAAIADWLSKEFGLPVVDRFPRNQTDLSRRDRRSALQQPDASGVPRGRARPWTGTAPIVGVPPNERYRCGLHRWRGNNLPDRELDRKNARRPIRPGAEMVHHLQYKLGFKHECPQDREKLAYAAQDRWLHLFGHSLELDFELDGFSVLSKTHCFY